MKLTSKIAYLKVYKIYYFSLSQKDVLSLGHIDEKNPVFFTTGIVYK